MSATAFPAIINLVDMTTDQIAQVAVQVHGDQAAALRNLLILADEEIFPAPEKPARALIEFGYLVESPDGFAWTDKGKESVSEALARLEPASCHPRQRAP